VASPAETAALRPLRRRVPVDLALAAASLVVQKLPGLVAAVVLARHFAKDEIGQFFICGTLALLAAMVTHLGTGQQLQRTAAQRPEAALAELGRILALRLGLTALVWPALNLAVWVAAPDLLAISLLTSLYVLVGDLFFAFGAVFVGLGKLGLRLATGAIGPLLIVAATVAAVAGGADLLTVLALYVPANLIMVGAALAVLRRRVGPVRLDWEASGAVRLVRACWPFFLIEALQLLQFKIDTVMIFALVSAAAVADYEVAYKLLEVSRTLVRPAAMVFFPACAAMAAVADWSGFRRTARWLLAVSAVLGLGLAVPVIPLAGAIVTGVWGAAYADSAPILRVLMLTLPPLYVSFAATYLAIALHLERSLVRVLLVLILFNVGLNAAAIPAWGALGAAGATLMTELAAAAVLTWLVLRALHARRTGPLSAPAGLAGARP
jgi:O-antigen/teichoic acid export membrane protein